MSYKYDVVDKACTSFAILSIGDVKNVSIVKKKGQGRKWAALVDSAFYFEVGGSIVIETQHCLSACEVDAIPVGILLGNSTFPHVVEQSFRDDTWEGGFDIQEQNRYVVVCRVSPCIVNELHYQVE